MCFCSVHTDSWFSQVSVMVRNICWLVSLSLVFKVPYLILRLINRFQGSLLICDGLSQVFTVSYLFFFHALHVSYTLGLSFQYIAVYPLQTVTGGHLGQCTAVCIHIIFDSPMTNRLPIWYIPSYLTHTTYVIRNSNTFKSELRNDVSMLTKYVVFACKKMNEIC